VIATFAFPRAFNTKFITERIIGKSSVCREGGSIFGLRSYWMRMKKFGSKDLY